MDEPTPVRNIKKFTEKDASDFRDNFAMHYAAAIRAGGGISLDHDLMTAYKAADKALEARLIGCDEIEMPCGCDEEKPGINMQELKIGENLPGPGRVVDFKPALERMEKKLNPKSDKKAPPTWFLLLMCVAVFLLCNGIWYVFAEGLVWLKRILAPYL